MRFSTLLILQVLIILGFCELSPVQASDVLRLDGKSLRYNVSPHTSYMIDESQQLTIDDVLDEANEKHFSPLPEKSANFGMTGHAYWFRFNVLQTEIIDDSWLFAIEYSHLDYIDLYIDNGGPELIHKRSGDRFPFSQREINHRYFLFNLPVETNRPASIYLRVQSGGAAEIPMHLVTKSAFFDIDHDEQYLRGIFFGVLGIMCLYNLALWAGARSAEYLSIGLWMLSFLALKLSVDGLGIEYFWGDSIWWSNQSTIVAIAVSYFFPVYCAFVFLPLKEFPKNRVFVKGLIVLYSLTMCASFFAPYKVLPAIMAAGLAGLTYTICMSLYIYLKGFRPARFFFLAWITLVVMAVLYGMQKNGLIPVSFVVTYGLEIGGIMQALLLSLGQSEKIYEINKSIRKAKEKALQAQIEVNKVTESMKHELERQVEDRTRTIRTIVDNVQSGFLVVNTNYEVEEGFTKSCEKILGRSIHAGVHFADLFDMDSRGREHIELSLDQVFYDRLPEDVSLKQIGERFTAHNRVVKCEGSVIRGPDSSVRAVLFTVNDSTVLELTERENKNNRTLLHIVRDRLAFKIFAIEAIDQIKALSIGIGESTDENLAFILHTLKGNFASFGLETFVTAIHELENKSELSSDDLLELENSFLAFINENSEVFGLDPTNLEEKNYVIKRSTIDQLHATLEDEDSIDGALKSFRQWEASIRRLPARKIFYHLEENLYLLAKKMQKKVQFELQGGNILLDEEYLRYVIQNLVHVIRNSIDHGIEFPEDRGSKSEHGLIKVTVEEEVEGIRITVTDDGSGINTNLLRKRLSERQILSHDESKKLSDSEILDYIFYEGFSTRNEATLISGRGVGLAALKKAVEDRNGEIKVRSSVGQGTDFSIRIPIPMSEAYPASIEKTSA
ncbi:MAG: Hpt domain-containing protein [Pseudobacteriovorax sp.]|nr:Hpt domain-containing protein [Pseudobacteriovorax sp.]